jgi:hypothetical protein
MPERPLKFKVAHYRDLCYVLTSGIAQGLFGANRITSQTSNLGR